MPVTSHESLQVAAVPGFDLRNQEVFDALLVFLPDFASRRFLLVLLLLLGIDFLPLSIASGPLMLLLAGLSILNALLGLWLQGVSLTVFVGIDGLLKIIFGILMLMARPVYPDTERGVRRSL